MKLLTFETTEITLSSFYPNPSIKDLGFYQAHKHSKKMNLSRRNKGSEKPDHMKKPLEPYTPCTWGAMAGALQIPIEEGDEAED